jgi:hypothetical protein
MYIWLGKMRKWHEYLQVYLKNGVIPCSWTGLKRQLVSPDIGPFFYFFLNVSGTIKNSELNILN